MVSRTEVENAKRPWSTSGINPKQAPEDQSKNFGTFSKFTFNMHTCKLVRATAMSTYTSLSLRTLKNGLNHPSGLLPMRHPGHGVDQPLFDRYGTLRTFFKRHSTVE